MTVRQFHVDLTNSAVLVASGADWAAARTAASGTIQTKQTSGAQWYTGTGTWQTSAACGRVALTFDTTNLPSNSVITRASIRSLFKIVCAQADWNNNDFAGYLVQGNHAIPPVPTDFGSLLGQVTHDDPIVAQRADSFAFPHTYGNEDVYDLTATGIGWIVKNGITKFGIRAHCDIDNTAPDNSGNSFNFGSLISHYGSQTTGAATAVTMTTATLNATCYGLKTLVLEVEYTSAGEDPSTVSPRYLFSYYDYGYYSGPAVVTPYVTDISTINVSGGSLVYPITSLLPGTLYYAGAISEFDAGSYGGPVVDFTTGSGTVYPTRPLTRVSAIKHIFQAGEEGRPGIYRMQLILGGLSAGWFPTFTGVQPTAPPPDSAVSGDWTTLNLSKSMDGQQLLAQYGRWLSERTPAQIKAIFGHPPTFDEWRQWYVVYGTGAF
jgi:hypothetical protein